MSELRATSNSSDTNHLEELKVLLSKEIEKLVIASPFLASNLPELLDQFSFQNVKAFELITTFKPEDPEQLTKPFALKALFDYFYSNFKGLKFKVHVDNHLHGKVYIADYGSSKKMIVTSANFTKNGLCNNHEWGIVTSDETVIDEVYLGLFENIDYAEITSSQIDRACLITEENLKRHPEWKTKPTFEYIDTLERVYSEDDGSNPNPQYFLKPIGVSEDPILLTDEREFGDLHENLHYSKKKPSGVRKGDVVITVAVTAGALVSFYKVTGGIQHVKPEDIEAEAWKERWPWYMEGRNLSQEFGKQWWKFNIQRKDALNEFLEQYPGVPVTAAGGYSLGTLSFGSDKVKITKEFGNFLIDKIEKAV